MTTPTLEQIKRHAEAHGFAHPSTGVRLGAWLVAGDGTRPPAVLHLGSADRLMVARKEGVNARSGDLLGASVWDGNLYRCYADALPFADRRWSALTLSGDLADEDEAEWRRVRKVYEDREDEVPASLAEVPDEDWCSWCNGTGIAP